MRRRLQIGADAALIHPVAFRHAQELPVLGEIAEDMIVVIAGVQPRQEVIVEPQHLVRNQIAGAAAQGQAVFILRFLVAIDGIVQEMGEVVPQGQPVADGIGMGFERALAQRGVILAGQAVALRLAAIAGIERAEPADQALGDRAFRLVGGGIPQAAIIHRRQRIAVVGLASGIAQHRVQLALIVRTVPGPVIMLEFQGPHHRAVRHSRAIPRRTDARNPSCRPRRPPGCRYD